MEWTNAQIIDVLSEKNYVIGVDSNPQRGMYQCFTDTQVSRVISVLNRPMQWLVNLTGSFCSVRARGSAATLTIINVGPFRG